MALKRIYEYLDYRQFLKDFYRHKKARTRYFSYRYFNQKAGISSSSLLKQVMDGERGLTGPVTEKFIKGLGLKKREAAYFRTLVKYNQGKTTENKGKYIEELLRHSGVKRFYKLGKYQYELYKDWWTLPIREMVGFKNFREDPKWIAARLRPRVTATRVKKSLSLLKKLGFVKYDKSGRLVLNNPIMTTGDEVNSLAIRNFHKQMITLAKESVDTFPKDKREVSSLTVGISKDTDLGPVRFKF